MRGDHRSENAGANEIFHAGSHQFRESLRELLRELWCSYCSSRGMPFREWNFVLQEWNFKFRELLREYPGTLRELREWPFHSESAFPEIGVVPRLLNCGYLRESANLEDFVLILGSFFLILVGPFFPEGGEGAKQNFMDKGSDNPCLLTLGGMEVHPLRKGGGGVSFGPHPRTQWPDRRKSLPRGKNSPAITSRQK